MHQCYGAVENMFRAKYPPPNLTTLKRKSLGDLEHPAKKPANAAGPEPTVPGARVIQPRPPPNGLPPAAPSSGSTRSLTASGKKRGRPSRADKEAQARAAYGGRTTDYPPITAAPLAPIAIQPHRDPFPPAPNYETVGPLSIDQRPKHHPRPSMSDSNPSSAGPYPIASPASTAGTPRAMPDPADHGEKPITSPRDPGHLHSRSPPVLPRMYAPSSQPPTLSPIQSRGPPPPPLQHMNKLPPYEPYRVQDPIFPDRNRPSTSAEQSPQQSQHPSTSITNRT